VLDIGCGPRGSLEWADTASERIGLDPLPDEYRRLGAGAHRMRYVAAGSEDLPFPSGYFDVACTFNSLDHVDDLGRAIAEIQRVIEPGGLLLLLTELNHPPTLAEPMSFSWEILDAFGEMEPLEVRHYERSASGLYDSILQADMYDHADPRVRYGILSAKLRKPEGR